MSATISPADLLATQARGWAQFQSAYSQCNYEIRAVVDDMVQIANDPDATPDEVEAAIHTIVEAVFPLLAEDVADQERRRREGDAGAVIAAIENEQEHFAENVRRFMAERGMTQEELASKVGVSQSAVSNMLSRKSRPQSKTVSRFANALGVPAESLLSADSPHRERLSNGDEQC